MCVCGDSSRVLPSLEECDGAECEEIKNRLRRIEENEPES